MTDTPSTPSAPARHSDGRFGPGNPGRRVGSRNRASHKLVMSIIDDFDSHKKELLQFLRTYRTENYFNTIMRLVPPLLANEASDFETYSDAEAAQVVGRVRQALAVQPDPRRALDELDAILSADPAPSAAR